MNYRHGDLGLFGGAKLPEGLKESKEKVLHRGSNNNPHSFKGGKWYPKTEGINTIGYLVGESTVLYHVTHGDKIKGKVLRERKIVDDVYVVKRQVLHTNEGMKLVED